MKKTVHVVKNGNNWSTKLSKSDNPISNHKTQEKAIESGIKIAKKMETELVIHRPNGQIREKNSYMKDPFPPKG